MPFWVLVCALTVGGGKGKLRSIMLQASQVTRIQTLVDGNRQVACVSGEGWGEGRQLTESGTLIPEPREMLRRLVLPGWTTDEGGGLRTGRERSIVVVDRAASAA